MTEIKMTLSFDSNDLARNLALFNPRVDGMVHAVMSYQSDKALAHMKTTAPWRDRTGNARNGLNAEALWEPLKSHTIRLFHRVSYGLFLEVRWAGKYAVIAPTIQHYGPDTMRLLQKLFGKLGGR